MKNDVCVIGLFQGMFVKNIITFNPELDQDAASLNYFTDVRELQNELKSKGIKIEIEADEKTTRPASLVVNYPDANPILFDQHV